jgi:hypothetical protein
MSKFNYTLPSGAKFTVDTPTGTTQTQADYIFYSQVAAGALVGFKPGQSVSGTTSTLAKFTLSRLDRGTAGVEDTVILSIVNGLPTTAAIPNLINVPLENPVTQANVAAINTTGFTAPAIGSLTSTQTQALIAQVAATVDQPATTITNDKGVGQFGFSCQQLEMAGFVKPGTWQQFLQNTSNTLVEVLGAPGIWTGKDGVYTLTDFLNNQNAQNDAQATLMANGYQSLQAAGVITTPAAQSITAPVGEVYTGSNQQLTDATTTLTNTVNSQVAALVTNSSKFGTELTAQWANTLPNLNSITSNLTGITGQLPALSGLPGLGTLTSGITPSLATVQTAMNSLGKVSQFAANASSLLTNGLGSLSTLSLSSLTNNLPNVSVITNQLQGQATALLKNAAGQLQGQATALLNQAQGQAQALLNQAQGQFTSLIAQGDALVAGVQKAAGFANTVNRSTVDVAFTKILGSSKIPTPSFGTPDSASIASALDISKAQSVLQGLQGQATTLAGQVQGQATALASQAQTAAGNLPVFNASQVNKIITLS